MASLKSAEEGEKIYRELAAARPDVYLKDFGRVLSAASAFVFARSGMTMRPLRKPNRQKAFCANWW